MTQRSKAPARALAVVALICAFVVLVVLIAAAFDNGGSGGTHRKSSGGSAGREVEKTPKKTPATYTVQNGDTLTSIAHHTGVTVAQIQRLNPEVDPQILISGEKLKLR
jgi:LysM repeat protein